MMLQVSASQPGASAQVPQRRVAKRARYTSTMVHVPDQILEVFAEKWFSDPESVDEETFDNIQLHLLGCKVCASIAKRYEDVYIARTVRVSAA